MRSLTLPSPAKINRFLHIVGRREDGYHLLETLFQFVDLHDELHFELRNDDQIVLMPETQLGIGLAENLIYRAACMLQQSAQHKQGINIHWQKSLPLGSGLGAGSSNAATTLLALNWLWQLNYSQDILMSMALKLGADVPVFVLGQTSWGEGIGEQLTPVSLPPTWALIVLPNCHVATAKMYASPQLTRNTPRLRIGTLIQGETELMLSGLKNDFEPVVRNLHPEVDEALTWLSNYGEARLSGSGASVFVCFKTEQEANEVAQQLPHHWRRFVTQGLNQSPLLKVAENLGLQIGVSPSGKALGFDPSIPRFES